MTPTNATTAAAPAPKLSELIRRGSTMVDGRQYFGEYVGTVNGEIACCALGAAYFAIKGGVPDLSDVPYILADITGWTVQQTIFTTCFDGNDRMGLLDWITDHNDQGETFEEIAAALEAKGL